VTPWVVGRNSVPPLAFLVALWISLVFVVPPGLMLGDGAGYGVNAAAIVVGVSMATPLLLNVLLRRRCVAMEAATRGFLLSFLLHFAMYGSPRRSWEYLFTDVKMLFLRLGYQSWDTIALNLSYLDQTLAWVRQMPLLFLV